MRNELKQLIIDVCETKIAQKGEEVNVSFYAFFKSKNDRPESLFEVATWWIKTHELDHFEKATRVIALVKSGR